MASLVKRCNKCLEALPLTDFYVFRSSKDGHQDRCKECQKAYHQTPEGKRRQRNSHYLRQFGITLSDYEEMWDSQDGLCAICSRPSSSRRLHVDHDHSTGAVRGLLCYTCNRALGDFRDDLNLIQAAVDYLKVGQ